MLLRYDKRENYWIAVGHGKLRPIVIESHSVAKAMYFYMVQINLQLEQWIDEGIDN
jgi:hypothetical protein